MIEFLMLNLQIAEVLLLAVCAYCLSVLIGRIDGSKHLETSKQVSKRIITIGGAGFALWIAWCAVMAFGYSAPA